MKRVSVIGTTGSGKTTFARALARRMNARHIELDALHWEPNWVEAPREIFRARVEIATRGDAWTVDGNYSQARDIVWARADTVVWLDFSFPVVLWRLTTRTFKRVFTREELWNRNRENFATQFFTRDSLFLWLFRTYWRRRKEYPELFARPENQHFAMVRFDSPRRAQTWLEQFAFET